MCGFVPGEVIAIGPIGKLHDLKGLPGDVTIAPLLTEEGEPDFGSPLVGIGAAVLRTDPGVELQGLSQMSARLSDLIAGGDAVVDLNHRLPLSSAGAGSAEAHELRLSPIASRWADRLRIALRDAEGHRQNQPGPLRPLRVAILDSGLNPALVAHRQISYLDYSVDGRYRPGEPPRDPSGHGTRVVKILDEILPPSVEMLVGRLPADEGKLTSLVVANAIGDLVARHAPDVVNLSVALGDSAFFCPSCRKRVQVPGFLPAIFNLVLRLAARSAQSTVTVMAAGNAGQLSNSRFLEPDLDSLILAVALNQRGEQARYSHAPSGPRADLFSATAFGGDDADDPNAMGVFLDGQQGTSFAAPFVTAATVIAQARRGIHGARGPADIVGRTRGILDRCQRPPYLVHELP